MSIAVAGGLQTFDPLSLKEQEATEPARTGFRLMTLTETKFNS